MKNKQHHLEGGFARVRLHFFTMAITKILARKGRLAAGIKYILNGDKTEKQILTAHLNCDPGRECRQMLDTKRTYGKTDGVQYYHVIQSFKPGEVSPELALDIAKEFAQEHLPGYEAVVAVHVDKEHIHAHIIFNSVNADTGEKYHSTPQTYYSQIRAISDRLCREHGLSVIMEGQPSRAVSYIEWLRQSKGQPTFRSMLEADLRTAIESANDLGHFYLLMEHIGYEIYHGNRLGFRLRGQDRFMCPERKNPLFSEDGIQTAMRQAPEREERPVPGPEEGRQGPSPGKDRQDSQTERDDPEEPPLEAGRQKQALRRKLPNDPWEIEPPKKDFRSERDSRDTKTRSSMRSDSREDRMENERPSILDKLKGYRAQLDSGRQSVPAKDKGPKVKHKQR